MTAYFDNFDHALKLASILSEDRANDLLKKIEEELVYDVSLCLESPDFPTDLRERGHRIILQHGVYTRPLNDPAHPTVDGLADAFRAVSRMSSDLHSLFHAVVYMEVNEGLEGFSDDPRSPMRRLATKGEAFREELVEKAKTQG